MSVLRNQGLLKRMARLGIDESKLEERFARSSGPGGQNVNKVSTAVTVSYGRWSVTAQDSRSQLVNRQLARQRLVELMEGQQREAKLQRRAVAAKARRQNPRLSKAAKAKRVEAKRHRSTTKRMRSGHDLE